MRATGLAWQTLVLLCVLSAFWGVIGNIAFADDVYDSYTLYSTTDPQVGPFYYYYYANGTYYAMQHETTPWERWHGYSDWTMINSYQQCPDGEDTVLWWQAPDTGLATITSHADWMTKKATSGGDGVYIYLFRVSATQGTYLIWQKYLAGDNTTGFDLADEEISFGIEENDLVVFQVSNNQTTTSDKIHFAPVITVSYPSSVTYDALDDFSASSPQPVNGWSYLESEADADNPSYTEMTAGTNLYLAEDGISYFKKMWNPNYIQQYIQGEGPDLARMWEAAEDGIVNIATAQDQNVRMDTSSRTDGDGATIRMYRNDVLFYERTLDATDTTGFALDEDILVNKGDQLYFVVNRRVWGGVSVVFDPIITWQYGGGYNPASQTWRASSSFPTSEVQGDVWYYMYIDKDTGNTVQMPHYDTDWPSTGENYFGASTTSSWPNDSLWYVRIWDDGMEAHDDGDPLRVWQAPSLGMVELTSYGNFRKKWTGGDGATMSILFRRDDETAWTTVWSRFIEADDTTGLPVAKRLGVNVGDEIALSISSGSGTASGDAAYMDVDVVLYPVDAPETEEIVHNDDYEVTGTEVWFNEHHIVNGDLILRDGDSLIVADGTLEIGCQGQVEHEILWGDGGRLETTNCIITGTQTGTVSYPTALDMHWWYESTYHTTTRTNNVYLDMRDTRVQYNAGIMAGDKTYITADGLIPGRVSDAIIMDGTGTTKISNSAFPLALHFDVGQDDTSSYRMALPTDTTISSNDIFPALTNGFADFDWADYDLELSNFRCTFWFLFANNVLQSAYPKTITLDECGGGNFNIQGTDLVAEDMTLPIGDLGECENGYVDTFNLRWQDGNTNDVVDINMWGAYLLESATGETYVQFTAPTRAGESMAHAGAAMIYEGDSDWSAETQPHVDCTALRAFGNNETEPEDNTWIYFNYCKLGPYHPYDPTRGGEISATNGAHVDITHCTMDKMNLVAQTGYITLCDVEFDSTTPTVVGNNVELDNCDCMNFAWTYLDDLEGWTGAGFDTTQWEEQQGSPDELVAHMSYPTPPSEPWNNLYPRISAPYDVRDLSFVTTDDLFLVMRCRVSVAAGNSDDTIWFQIESKREGESNTWANKEPFVRQGPLDNDGDYHYYVWNLNDPYNAQELTGVSEFGWCSTSWLPYEDKMDTLSFQFGLNWHDWPSGGTPQPPATTDFVDVDYIVITNDFTQYTENFDD